MSKTTIKITKCPTAYAVKCSGETSLEDKIALAQHHARPTASFYGTWGLLFGLPGAKSPRDLESMLNG